MEKPTDVVKPFGELSRRRLLGLTGGFVGAGLLGGCQISTETDPSGASGGGGQDAKLKLPDSGARIPDRDIEFQWMDSGDLKGLFHKPLFEAYQQKHPNVTIDYQDSSWDTINESIPLAVRNKRAPDVFQLPENVPVQTAVNERWIRPIDELVPDFEQWKGRFGEDMFLEGVHVFDGKTYTWPLTASKRLSKMVMFDPEYLRRADVDPIAERFTWTSFRQACKKITRQGDGDYYGLMAAGDAMAGIAINLARLAGMRCLDEATPFDFRTGEYVANSPELVAAFELLLQLKSDGSFFPGFLGLGDADSRARMPNRVAGMIFDGPWDIPEWQATNPDYEFDIALPPYGDDEKTHCLGYQENGVNFMYVSVNTENEAVVGDLFAYMGSVEGQTQMVLLSEGNLTSVIPAANEAADEQRDELDPLAVKAIAYADELMRIAPKVESRNPDISMVQLQMDPVSPTLTEIGEGVVSGKITDIGRALRDFDDQAERNLDRAIEAARKQGAKISRDDWVFPNWDPSKDYTPDDYEALAK